VTAVTPALPEWRKIADRIEALSAAESAADDVRRRATATLDLLQLVATWPVPRTRRFEEDLAASLSDLCQETGVALCDGRICLAGTSCRIVMER